MVYQVWFADDATAAASGEQLKQWWDALSTFGPHFGYSPNATKTILVVKDEHERTAKFVFLDTGIKITTHGKWHLGVAICLSSGARTITSRRKPLPQFNMPAN